MVIPIKNFVFLTDSIFVFLILQFTPRNHSIFSTFALTLQVALSYYVFWCFAQFFAVAAQTSTAGAQSFELTRPSSTLVKAVSDALQLLVLVRGETSHKNELQVVSKMTILTTALL